MHTPHVDPHYPAHRADEHDNPIGVFPPHKTFTSQHSLNYLDTCHKIIPDRQSVLALQRLADKVPLTDVPNLLREVRTVAIQRSTATLTRARTCQTHSKEQLKNYERYLGLARTGKSLLEQTLNNSFNKRLAAKQPTDWTAPS